MSAEEVEDEPQVPRRIPKLLDERRRPEDGEDTGRPRDRAWRNASARLARAKPEEERRAEKRQEKTQPEGAAAREKPMASGSPFVAPEKLPENTGARKLPLLELAEIEALSVGVSRSSEKALVREADEAAIVPGSSLVQHLRGAGGLARRRFSREEREVRDLRGRGSRVLSTREQLPDEQPMAVGMVLEEREVMTERRLVGLEAQDGLEAEGDRVRESTSLEPRGRCAHQFEKIPRPRRLPESHEDLGRREPRDLGHERAIEIQKAAGGRDGVEESGTVLESLLEDRDLKRASRVVERAPEEGLIRLGDERGGVRARKPLHEPEKVRPQRTGTAADTGGVILRAHRAEPPEQRHEESEIPSSGADRSRRALSRLPRRDPVVVALGPPRVDDGEGRSFEQRAHLLRRELHAVVRVGAALRVLPPPAPVHLKAEHASRLKDARGLFHVAANRGAAGNVLEHDEREDEVEGFIREMRKGTVRERCLHVRPVRRILLRLLDHDGRNVHAVCDRDALGEGNEKPADAAPDLEDLRGRIEDDAVENDRVEILGARGPERLLGACVSRRDVELVILLGSPIPVAAHAGDDVSGRRLLHRDRR